MPAAGGTGDPGSPLFGAASRYTPEAIALAPADEAEVRAIAARNKIAAIERVRELTGSSLRAAKDYVEGLG